MASFIAVPEAHVQERRVAPTAEPEVGPGGPIPPLVRILSSVEKPDDAFVAVPYRGYWYWIDDRDLPSKALFSFLMFRLHPGGDRGQGSPSRCDDPGGVGGRRSAALGRVRGGLSPCVTSCARARVFPANEAA